MTKSEKREATIRQNPKQVRFDDLDALLRSYDFAQRQPRSGSSHYKYTHPRYKGKLEVPRPHGTHVRPFYVQLALAAIDRVKEAAE